MFPLLFGTFLTAGALRTKSLESTITVPDDFPTVQAAINNASDGDTIFIRAGAYNEGVTINKTLTLLGENGSTTTISSVYLYANDTSMEDLTMGSLALNNVSNMPCKTTTRHLSSHSIHTTPIFSRNNLLDFRLYNCSEFSIEENVFDFTGTSGTDYQAYLRYLSNSTFSRNTVINGSQNQGCFFLGYCTNNTFLENNFMNNVICLWFVGADNNAVYHNSFKNNTYSYFFRIVSFGNVFDAGYPAGGNYYSDYFGNDSFSGAHQNETGSDGLGDTPREWYTLSNMTEVLQGRDNYPLMKPYSGPHDIGVLIKASKTVIAQSYNASVVVNTTVINYGMQSEDSNFTFNMLGVNYDTAVSVQSRTQPYISLLWTRSGSRSVTTQSGLTFHQYRVKQKILPNTTVLSRSGSSFQATCLARLQDFQTEL